MTAYYIIKRGLKSLADNELIPQPVFAISKKIVKWAIIIVILI